MKRKDNEMLKDINKMHIDTTEKVRALGGMEKICMRGRFDAYFAQMKEYVKNPTQYNASDYKKQLIATLSLIRRFNKQLEELSQKTLENALDIIDEKERKCKVKENCSKKRKNA